MLYLNNTYDMHRPYSPWLERFSKYLISVAVLVVLLMWVYAHFKWALTPGSSDGLSLFTGIIGNTVKLVGIVSLSLLPVVLLSFSGYSYVQGKLLQKYSEEFRKEYDFTKEEWYEED